MRKPLICKTFLVLISMIAAIGTFAQALGSTDVESGLNIGSDGTISTKAESLYIGPGTYQIDGTWLIYSKNVYIDPNAVISGSGQITFNNSADAGGTSGITVIDGNNTPINVNISIHTAAGVLLQDIADPGFGSTNPSGSSAAALNSNATVSLDVDGANIDLNGNDLVFGDNGIITNFNTSRMVITDNNIAGHIIKSNPSGTTFSFPVGIAASDFTPAVITGTGTFHVSVQDYSAAVPLITNAAYGMNRTWHIYGNTATTTTLTLQHNNSTNGASYVDEQSYITNYTSGSWSINGGVDYQNIPGIDTRAGNPILNTGTNAWYSKTSSQAHSLPIILVQPLVATLKGTEVLLSWQTGIEINFDHFILQTSTSSDANSFSTLAIKRAQGSNSSYSAIQTNPANGANYYRLVSVDLDGTTKIYPTVMLNINVASNIVAFPNPTQGLVTVKGIQPNDILKVYNTLGQLVAEQKAASNQTQIDLSRNTAGVYFILVARDNDIVQKIKIMKQ
ncbi:MULTISPECIES: T9SS type A sorting domain-containing protein [Chitinophagaceae]